MPAETPFEKTVGQELLPGLFAGNLLEDALCHVVKKEKGDRFDRAHCPVTGGYGIRQPAMP